LEIFQKSSGRSFHKTAAAYLKLCLHDLVVFKDCKYNFRYSNIVDIPRVRTSTYGKNSFKYAAAVLWNDLPDDLKKKSNFNQLKKHSSSSNNKP
jgi:hypothetical protein